jgi:hypothetical protein
MATAAKPKTEKPKTPRELAEELVGIHVANRATFGRIDELKELLKAAATAAGASIREVIPGQGKVAASGRKESEFRGDLPELDPAAWNALSESRRDKLIADGVVKIVPTWSKTYYGSVTVDLF